MSNKKIKEITKEIEKYSNELLDAGFRVFQHEKDSSWLIFGKGNNVGYAEYNPIKGWNFSTKHKANAITGTGFIVYEEIHNPIVQDAYDTFIIAPNCASQKERDSVVKYDGIDDYVQKAYLNNIELKKNRKSIEKEIKKRSDKK